MREPADLEAAYLAGVLDSDGCIGVARSTYAMRLQRARQPMYQARVIVKQVQHQAIGLFREIFDGTCYQQASSARRGRPLWTWEVQTASAGRVLKATLPHLRLKRAQAENALEVCRLMALPRGRFPVPKVVPGEPLVTTSIAAARLSRSPESICQAARKGSVPFVRDGRRILIPESYLPIWASRGHTPRRSEDITAQLEACYQRAKELNRVGLE